MAAEQTSAIHPTPPAAGTFVRSPISRRYALGIFGDIVRITAVVCLGVEGIFLADLLIAEILPRVIEHRGGPVALFQLMSLSAPEGLFLSLPLAILIGTYLTLVRRRESGEFILIASMGFNSRLLFSGIVLVGLAFFAFSSLISAYVEPLSRFYRERAYVNMMFRSLSNAEIGAGKFYSLDGLTVFASSGRLTDGAENVFIARDLGNGEDQLMLAERSEGVGGDGMAAVGLMLTNLTMLGYTLKTADGTGLCNECEAPMIAPENYNVVNRQFVGLPSLQRPILGDRQASLNDNTTAELLFKLEREDARNALGKRIFRGLLCLLAPLLALLAMSFTKPSTVLLALPGAGAILLGGSFFGPRLIDVLSPMPLAASATYLSGMVLAVLLLIHLMTRWREAFCFRLAKVNL